MKYLVVLISISLGAFAQFLFKRGVEQIKTLAVGSSTEYVVPLLKNASIWTGLSAYGVSVLLWFYVLSKMDLSKAYPLVSMGYVITLFFGYFFLNEALTAPKCIGIGLIILGVFVLSR